MTKSVDKIVRSLRKMVTELEKCCEINNELYLTFHNKAADARRESDFADKIANNLKSVIE